MPTINELTPEQIRNPEIYQKIKDLGDSFVRLVQAKEAWSLQDKLNSLLKISNLQNFNPELQKKYNNLLAALRWIAFPLLAEEDALLLLKNNYLSVLDNEDIDTRERIEARMFTLDLFPRNELRQKMQKALKENTEQLGNKTFGEWMIDYSKAFDFRDRTELTPSEYTRQSPEVRVLSEQEKSKLRKAFQIFDKTLLVTPVMSEPLFSITVMKMIQNGIIDKASIDPVLLQTIFTTARTAAITSAAPIARAPIRPAPAPIRPATARPIPPIPARPVPIPTPIAKEEVKEVKEVKEKPTGLFEKMFGEPDKSAKRILTGPPESESFGGKIQEEMPTFPEEPEEIKEMTGPAPQPAPLSPTQGGYRIRTMKQDIEKTKRQPIPKKPEPKIHDNIVDLSGK